MGLFLSASGVVGVGADRVVEAVVEVAKSVNGGVEAIEEKDTEQPNIAVVQQKGDNTTILYPNHFSEWNKFSKAISECLSAPVFSFHIHDGDFWMYLLFENGQEVGRFNPIPDYWEALEDSELEKWKGDADLVCRLVPGVERKDIEGYLVRWDPEGEPVKAYPDDEFEQSDWQMCDFMNKVGLPYPMDDKGNVLGQTYRLWTKDLSLEKLRPKRPAHAPEPGPTSEQSTAPKDSPKKPWWKFW